jgi:hypothetical protein
MDFTEQKDQRRLSLGEKVRCIKRLAKQPTGQPTA